MEPESDKITIDDLRNAPPHLAQEILLLLCKSDRKILDLAIDHLAKIEKQEKPAGQEQLQPEQTLANTTAHPDAETTGAQGPDDPANRPSSHKRKRDEESLACVRCKRWFVQKDNGPEACQFHPGEPERNDDYFDYYPGDAELDEDDMFNDCPEGFEWDCCKKPGDQPGCTRSWHETRVSKGTAPSQEDKGQPGPADEAEKDGKGTGEK